jgi:exopolyphosphatase/guanosine-5'-triphosphate,3'-diphosphate pyrophosphatase
MSGFEGPSAPLTDGTLGDDPVAVVEVGSGSVKLLVTDADALASGGPDPVRWPIKTRLWADGAAELAPGGLAATAEAFGRFATVVADTGAVDVAVVATAVAREVADVGPLDRLCRDAFGVELEIVSGAREAELGFAGATAGRELGWPCSLLDIGAGSTEVATAVGPGDGVRRSSLPIGARVLADAYLHRDPPGPDELSSALSVVELHYDDLRRDVPELAPALASGPLFGVGAIGQIAAVEIGLADPNDPVDGHRLLKRDIEEVFRLLATEPAQDRANNPGLAPEHVDDIVGGLCVLVEFMRRFDVAELVVSERNLRHGRAAELVAARRT